MLNAEASLAAKRTGQQLSIMFDGEWTVAVLVELRAWLADRAAAGHRTMTFEQFRHDAIAQPHSPNAWGSLASVALKAGLIAEETYPNGAPVYVLAESVKTHRHPVRRWLLASSFFAAQDGTNCPSSQDASAAEAVHSQEARERVGEGRHSHAAAGGEVA